MITRLSWGDVERLSEELGRKITESGFVPDYIIGITTGGIIPLGLLVKALGVKNILTVSVSSYEKNKQKELAITYLPEVDMEGRKILLVDEIADTGTTLNNISEALGERYKIGVLKTATIAVNKAKCAFWPDFFALADESEWVVFPWEKKDFPEYF